MMPVEERERRSPLCGFSSFFSRRMMTWILMYLHSNTPPPSPFLHLPLCLFRLHFIGLLIHCSWPFCPCPCLGFCICLSPSCFRVIVYVHVSVFVFVDVLVCAFAFAGGGGGDVGVGVAAAGFIFPCLYLAIFFPILYKRLKHNKGEDFIWAPLAPCPILLVRETIFFYSSTRLKWSKYAIVI